MRTCDAVGACIAAPDTAHYRRALSHGDTLSHGVPEAQVEAADACVEIPMVGTGASLNVAVAGSLVLCGLAGMA